MVAVSTQGTTTTLGYASTVSTQSAATTLGFATTVSTYRDDDTGGGGDDDHNEREELEEVATTTVAVFRVILCLLRYALCRCSAQLGICPPNVWSLRTCAFPGSPVRGRVATPPISRAFPLQGSMRPFFDKGPRRVPTRRAAQGNRSEGCARQGQEACEEHDKSILNEDATLDLRLPTGRPGPSEPDEIN